MKRPVMLLALAALALTARPARAQTTVLQACIADCDAQFPTGDWGSASIRGWCYLLNCT